MIYEVLLNQSKQIKIQELTKDQKSQHYYIDESDICYYFGEYTAAAGFAYSDTNQLVHNFKKTPDRRCRPEWRYKLEAISQVSLLINNATNPQPDMFFVPVPPSKNKNDPLYDDRLLQVLGNLNPGWMGNGFRELVTQINSTEAAHTSSNTRDIQGLVANYSIDMTLALPEPKGIIIFDDVLTTGCHYKAVQQTLRNLYPNVTIMGLFLARRKLDELPNCFGNITL